MLNREDKKDITRKMGAGLARKVAGATNDKSKSHVPHNAKSKALKERC